MKHDILRWETKYRGREATADIEPDSVLTTHRDLLEGRGIALDLAAGLCDNALYLADLGYTATAIDGSFNALRLGIQKAEANQLALNCFVADLETYPLPKNHFDLVVVIRYLDRNRIDALKQTVAPGGLLIFKTFNTHFLKKKPTFPREYVLQDGELDAWLGAWDCLDTNDTQSLTDTQTYWVGRRK